VNDISVLIGGKAGDGINQAGTLIARMLGSLGYRAYMYYDYPSLIRGGHNFAMVRASPFPIGTHRSTVDLLLALDGPTLTKHKHRCTPGTIVLYNADVSSGEGIGIAVNTIVEEENGIPIMGNSCLIGAFASAAGMDWSAVEAILTRVILKETEINRKIAKRGYDAAEGVRGRLNIIPLDQEALPLVSGNEAISLGLLEGGLDAYVAYPMTPSSSILHFLASVADRFRLKVVHPENEIAVMLMAQGFAYGGARTAVGTSGGGFCLMTEGLSMAAMAEVPVTIVVSQRGGPSTGIPTYTAQSDLQFILSAGQGEFLRFVVAPGNAEQAFEWSARALNLSWKYQVPSFILSDKTLSEGLYNMSLESIGTIGQDRPLLWNGVLPYRRYAETADGISPLAIPPREGAVIKVSSYAHDEDGITTEDPEIVAKMQEKRMRKEASMLTDIEALPAIIQTGTADAKDAILTWGSNADACSEVAAEWGLKSIQAVVLSPFPTRMLKSALNGVERIITVENNYTGQLTNITRGLGIRVDRTILRYNGRPYAIDELLYEVGKVIA
jgi:2-oxoglutarate ferredoxin oxidoreductase subunit alpha